MYFPYFRGKQYELLALRALSERLAGCEQIIPIIEPVNALASPIASYSYFSDVGMPFVLITNPSVGDIQDSEECKECIVDECLSECDAFYPALLVAKSTGKKDVVDFLDRYDQYRCSFVYSGEPSDEGVRGILSSYEDVSYHIFIDPSAGNRVYSAVSDDVRVVVSDAFNKADRNADYIKNPIEFFSHPKDMLSRDDIVGFGDYSVVGEEYMDNGWAPYAVAVHCLTYESDVNSSIYVRHYVSDDVGDNRNAPGKTLQAIRKLVHDIPNFSPVNFTPILDVYRNHFENNSAPGLGKIKQYGIQHHLELMLKFFD